MSLSRVVAAKSVAIATENAATKVWRRLRPGAVLALVLTLASPAQAGTASTDLGLRSVNGRGVMLEATCTSREGQLGSPGVSAHYRYSGAVAGTPVPLATTFEQVLDVHVSGARTPVKGGGGAFMTPEANAFVIVTPRGDLYGRQAAGSCLAPALSVGDGPVVSGAGDWVVTAGTQSLQGASGGGRFTMEAELGPAIDNALTMDLTGEVSVPSPKVTVSLERVLYADPLDYLFRQVTAVYRVANTGEGDAYNVRVMPGPNFPASTQTLGDPPVADIGELAKGERVPVTIRYRMDLLACPIPAIGCRFVARTILEHSDALDTYAPEVTDEWVINAPVLPL